jgi:hypothetical protein
VAHDSLSTSTASWRCQQSSCLSASPAAAAIWRFGSSVMLPNTAQAAAERRNAGTVRIGCAANCCAGCQCGPVLGSKGQPGAERGGTLQCHPCPAALLAAWKHSGCLLGGQLAVWTGSACRQRAVLLSQGMPRAMRGNVQTQLRPDMLLGPRNRAAVACLRCSLLPRLQPGWARLPL